jgi:hypothetical protein
MSDRHLPLSTPMRWRLKSAAFRALGWLLRDTRSYREWYGTARRIPVAFEVHEILDSTDTTTWLPIRLPACSEPIVSVIIPVFGRVDLTWRCLASIATHAPEAPIEVLVVDGGSPDDTAQRLGGIEHLRLIRLATGQGFIRACNRGAHEAWRYLLFLNSDTVVRTGWCDELVRSSTFQRRGRWREADLRMAACRRRAESSGRTAPAGTTVAATIP